MKNEITKLQQENERFLEKERQLMARQRKAEKMMMAQERKRRTRRLILIGAMIENVLGFQIEEEMLEKLKKYLINEEKSGRKVSKALKGD